MRAFLLLAVVGCSLAGCATTSDTSITNALCTHQIITTNAAEAALTAAAAIKDPAAQAAAIAAANATLALVASCPGYAGPAITAQ